MRFVVILLVLGLGVFFWHRSQSSGPLQPIVNPVYAETRVKWDYPGRTVEGLMLAKTADEADCAQYTKVLEEMLRRNAAHVCPNCTVQPSDCKAELSPRYLTLFDNVPSVVTYLSLDRDSSSERETRLIYWGVSVEESDRLCAALPEFQKGRKGHVSCVRARRQ